MTHYLDAGSQYASELATASYINWFNTTRLRTAIGGIPPDEYEAAHNAQTQPDPRLDPTAEASTKLGAVTAAWACDEVVTGIALL